MVILQIPYVFFFLLLGTENCIAGEKHQPILDNSAEDSACIGDLRKSEVESGIFQLRMSQKRVGYWASNDSLPKANGKDSSEHTIENPFSANSNLHKGKRIFRDFGPLLKSPFPVVM